MQNLELWSLLLFFFYSIYDTAIIYRVRPWAGTISYIFPFNPPVNPMHRRSITTAVRKQAQEVQGMEG